MLDKLFNLLCIVQMHGGTWHYDVDELCDQTRVCPRCGEKDSRVAHVVSRWHHDYFPETGYCDRCGKMQTRSSPPSIHGGR